MLFEFGSNLKRVCSYHIVADFNCSRIDDACLWLFTFIEIDNNGRQGDGNKVQTEPVDVLPLNLYNKTEVLYIDTMLS